MWGHGKKGVPLVDILILIKIPGLIIAPLANHYRSVLQMRLYLSYINMGANKIISHSLHICHFTPYTARFKVVGRSGKNIETRPILWASKSQVLLWETEFLLE